MQAGSFGSRRRRRHQKEVRHVEKERTGGTGLNREELEAQSAGLLPDRLEMRHRRHGRRRRGRGLVLVIVDDGNQFNNGIYYPPPYYTQPPAV